MAIGDSSGKKLKLCQIYDWIKERFPYYRVSPQWSPTTTLCLSPADISE